MKKYIGPVISGIILLILGIFVTDHYELNYLYRGIDTPLHIIGGAIAGWFFFIFLRTTITSTSFLRGLFIITASACFVGVLWEIAEYSSSQYGREITILYHYFHGGPLADTIKDITNDILGGFVIGAFILIRTKIGRSSKELSE
jgi:uncharacterized integral membrane protein